MSAFKLPPLRYQPPSPELAAMVERLAAECLEITEISPEVFGKPAQRITLKEPKRP